MKIIFKLSETYRINSINIRKTWQKKINKKKIIKNGINKEGALINDLVTETQFLRLEVGQSISRDMMRAIEENDGG